MPITWDAEPWDEATDLIQSSLTPDGHSTGRGPAGGYDIGASADMGNGYSLFFFGDTGWQDNTTPGIARGDSSQLFLRQTIGIVKNDVSSIAWYCGRDQGNKPILFWKRRGRDGIPAFPWFFGGKLLDDGKLMVYGSTQRSQPGATFGSEGLHACALVIQNPLDPPLEWVAQELELSSADRLGIASIGDFEHEGFLYGWPTSINFNVMSTRVRKEAVENDAYLPVQWWDGAQYIEDLHLDGGGLHRARKTVTPPNMALAPGVAVARIDGVPCLAWLDTLGTTLRISEKETPDGDWPAGVDVYNPPEVPLYASSAAYCYSPCFHPQLTWPGKLPNQIAFSYVMAGLIPAAPFPADAYDYFPRFLKLTRNVT